MIMQERRFSCQACQECHACLLFRSVLLSYVSVCLSARPRKSAISILAGTVACPECKAQPRYKRHTPNFVEFFGLQSPWHQKVCATELCVWKHTGVPLEAH